ncbi:MAG: Glyoxalase/bleomycin resistance protein/dioxygenase [Gemmatimonadetes bacterium]|nr:Glyoxalase/bleomycin resistance protein/dioxygenase [Gemmatimonadota bacterium]
MTDGRGIQGPVGLASEQGSLPSERQLPASLRLGPVRLQVGDLERSLEYYTGVLGLQLHSTAAGSATLTATEDAAPLVELVERPDTAPVQPHSRLGLYHFALLVPDRAALGRFLGHLARTGTRIGASDHLVSEAIYLRDPDGLGIEVYVDRPRSTWRHTKGQIEMATAPLDTEAVLAAAGDVPWSGMPAGTEMGHMHLHVADLDLASRFYHGALGFDRTVWSYPGALFLSAGGYHHHLGLNTWAGKDAAAPTDRDARLIEWSLRFSLETDAGVAARRLSEAGHSVSGRDGDWVVEDPWGTRLRLTTS